MAEALTNRLHAALARITRDLTRHARRFALVGGLAVSVRAEPRLTRDLDVAVVVADDADAEVVVRTLVADGYRAAATVEHVERRRLATVRLIAPGGSGAGLVVDVLFASSGIEAEVVADAELLEVLPGTAVPVARVGHLVALKLLARDDRARPQDADDLVALRRVTSDSEVARARQAVALIQDRGFARGRDLVASLDAWLDTEET
ncbi:MAG: nucleotidyl transferase AbiEii/AbiGii toxin family protein [Deltaproteobacteria bacterium]|nr:nucleotidyl transferase AbiEii/AbiGii toxin family protein [Deltaproteobacteria bacterium]